MGPPGGWWPHTHVLILVLAGNEAAAQVVWERSPTVPDFEKMHGFTRMAIEANEVTSTEHGCAITDSRFRVGTLSGSFPTLSTLYEHHPQPSFLR